MSIPLTLPRDSRHREGSALERRLYTKLFYTSARPCKFSLPSWRCFRPL